MARPVRVTTASAVSWLVLAVAMLVLGCGGGRPNFSEVPARTPERAPAVTTPPAKGQLFRPDPNPEATAQLAEIRGAGRTADAALLEAMIGTPSAVWFGGGSPEAVEAQVRAVVERSGDTVPVLVAYNVPGRDCAQYSAGGAATGDAYRAWIEAFSTGIGDHRAIVVVEPDGVAQMPGDCGQPDTFDRLSLVGVAIDAVKAANPAAAVYVDAGHSAWRDVGEISRRLVRAGVMRASGIALNVSNYQPTPSLIDYGTSVVSCVRQVAAGEGCDGTVVGQGAASSELLHLVIDTSRNGLGPWTATAPYSDAQEWCNPPGRGLGLRPTLETGNPLVDGYLWIKIPGESDGTCTRGAAAGSIDPEWGLVDPAAGEWFPQQALQLAQLANPPLVP